MATRLGVDVGGTFTDLILYDDTTNQIVVAKGPTTASAPEEGVVRLIENVVPPETLRDARFFLHGNTVALNAALERKGAVVGLLATRGFRDILELRRGERVPGAGLLWKPPPPLIPRWLRLPVSERMRANGEVEVPIRLEDVYEAARQFIEAGVDCIAIAFLNAYANPAHEMAARDALRDAGFEGEISLSHEVSREYREYERTSTTVIDAYVRPRVSGYLTRLEQGIREQGFHGDSLVTRSGGGAMTFREAERRPFETIMSGPVAGAVGAALLCEQLGIKEAITADVGGTSFDTCLIIDGHVQVKYEGQVAGMPLQATWVDVRSIGAGGGSIAYVDVGGLLRVGPRSAGAVPGPASYGRGGVEPTVTDAAAVLGMLSSGELAGGVNLDFGRAEAALVPLASSLSMPVEEVVRGILTIANASMADAIRSVTVEQGRDPRDARLIAFGGAGPVFATLLARELDITEIVIPNFAGNFSAWGLLGQDIIRSAALTSFTRLDDKGVAAAGAVLESLFARLKESADLLPLDGSSQQHEAALDLRYVGQEYTLTIQLPYREGTVDSNPQAIVDVFTTEYLRTFGHTMNEEIEIVSARATLRTPLPRPQQRLIGKGEHGVGPAERTVDAFSFRRGERIAFQVIDRASLSARQHLAGPTIILEDTATTYVDVGFDVEVHPFGVLLLTDTQGA